MQLAGEEHEQAQRRQVRPVQVVEDDHQGPLRRLLAQVRRGPVVDTEADRGLVAQDAASFLGGAGQLGQHGLAGPPGRARPARCGVLAFLRCQRAHHLDPRPEAGRAVALPAGAPHGGRPAVLRVSRRPRRRARSCPCRPRPRGGRPRPLPRPRRRPPSAARRSPAAARQACLQARPHSVGESRFRPLPLPVGEAACRRQPAQPQHGDRPQQRAGGQRKQGVAPAHDTDHERHQAPTRSAARPPAPAGALPRRVSGDSHHCLGQVHACPRAPPAPAWRGLHRTGPDVGQHDERRHHTVVGATGDKTRTLN